MNARMPAAKPISDAELVRFTAESDFYKTLDCWPNNGAVFPSNAQGGLWHDCSWAGRFDVIARELVETRRAIAEYLQVHKDSCTLAQKLRARLPTDEVKDE